MSDVSLTRDRDTGEAIVPAASIPAYRKAIAVGMPPSEVQAIVATASRRAQAGDDPSWGMIALRWTQQLIGTPTQTIITADATPPEAVYARASAEAQAHIDRLREMGGE